MTFVLKDQKRETQDRECSFLIKLIIGENAYHRIGRLNFFPLLLEVFKLISSRVSKLCIWR